MGIFDTEIIIKQQETYCEKEYFRDIPFTGAIIHQRMQFRSESFVDSYWAWFAASSMIEQ
jgi:hypothetical protein